MSKVTPKQRAWKWCAKFIKLRDAIEDLPITNDIELVICRTCHKWMRTGSREAQASHFISRGLGGSSGVYFSEINIHICCYQCNCFKQGAPVEYKEYMLLKYGQDVIDELELKHYIPFDGKELAMKAMEIHYKDKYKELVCKSD
ncbi:MAG: recombination protein NinG [Candidatus Scalindua sp.]